MGNMTLKKGIAAAAAVMAVAAAMTPEAREARRKRRASRLLQKGIRQIKKGLILFGVDRMLAEDDEA